MTEDTRKIDADTLEITTTVILQVKKHDLYERLINIGEQLAQFETRKTKLIADRVNVEAKISLLEE